MPWIWLEEIDFWYVVNWLGLEVRKNGLVPFASTTDFTFGLNPPCDPYGSSLPDECWTGKYSYINY